MIYRNEGNSSPLITDEFHYYKSAAEYFLEVTKKVEDEIELDIKEYDEKYRVPYNPVKLLFEQLLNNKINRYEEMFEIYLNQYGRERIFIGEETLEWYERLSYNEWIKQHMKIYKRL